MNQMRKISLSFLIASLMLAMLFAMVALAAPPHHA
jgi:hypothetical protein